VLARRTMVICGETERSGVVVLVRTTRCDVSGRLQLTTGVGGANFYNRFVWNYKRRKYTVLNNKRKK